MAISLKIEIIPKHTNTIAYYTWNKYKIMNIFFFSADSLEILNWYLNGWPIILNFMLKTISIAKELKNKIARRTNAWRHMISIFSLLFMSLLSKLAKNIFSNELVSSSTTATITISDIFGFGLSQTTTYRNWEERRYMYHGSLIVAYKMLIRIDNIAMHLTTFQRLLCLLFTN